MDSLSARELGNRDFVLYPLKRWKNNVQNMEFRHCNCGCRRIFVAKDHSSLSVRQLKAVIAEKPERKGNFKCLIFQHWSTNWGHSKFWFLRRGEDRSTRRKTSCCRVEKQKTQPKYNVESGNRTQAALVGDLTIRG